MLAGIVRGLCVGVGIWVVALLFMPLTPVQPLWMLLFAVMACGVFSSLGLVAGLWSEKFDQLALFQNFLIMPATFLSGVFYSIHSLPSFWQAVSHWNPVFYMIDGFRYGFFLKSYNIPELSKGPAPFKARDVERAFRRLEAEKVRFVRK